MASSLAVCSENNDTFISSPAAALASLQITQLTHNHDTMVFQERENFSISKALLWPPKSRPAKGFRVSITPAPFVQSIPCILFIFKK